MFELVHNQPVAVETKAFQGDGRAKHISAEPFKFAALLRLASNGGIEAKAIVSRIGSGVVADRIDSMPTLALGSACQASMLLALTFTTGNWGLMLAALLFGPGFSRIMSNPS